MGCMDDGSTEFRWHSIAFAGQVNAHRLLETLYSVPQDKRKVLHLYICDMDPTAKSHTESKMESIHVPLPQLPRIHDRSATDIPDDPIPSLGHSVMGLLELLAPTLETLSLVLFTPPRLPDASSDHDHTGSPPPERDLPLASLSFPNLKELTLRGVCPLPNSSTFAPKLRLVNLDGEDIPDR